MQAKQDDQFDDLKQFIDSRISQTESRLSERIDGLDFKFDELRQEMHDGFAGVGEAFDELHTQIAERDQQIDKRLTNLEQAA